MQRYALTSAAAVLLLAGCIPVSLHPVYTEETLVDVPELLGKWSDDPEEGYWLFEKEENVGEYRVTIQEKKEVRLVFRAHTALTQENLLLDMVVEYPDKSELEFYTVPVHLFWQIDISGDQLKMRTIDYQWLTDRDKKGRLWIKHETVDDRLVLTATPERMQRFVRNWVKCDEAWSDWEELPRIKE